MARIVQKFGGTSVGTVERIKIVAEKVKATVEQGHQVAVVVSAMAGTTNQLVAWTKECGILHDAREYDTVVAAGEQITVGLLAIALQNIGVDARSWLGWQVPIYSDDTHGSARIERIETENLIARLEQGQVAVVAGFQGVGPNQRISTLGRGGSDTSAVALAAALDADRCDIFTDVDGVYTCDPRVVPKARKLDVITFEEMLELASGGAKVLQTRSVAMAMRHGVKLQVLSSFEDLPGTMVIEEKPDMEKNKVNGIAFSVDEAKVTLVAIEDAPGVAATLFGALADANINVDMIVQTAASAPGKTDITFSVPGSELERSQKVIADIGDALRYQDIITSADVCKVSVVGVAMRSQPGVAKTMFATLAEKGINIEVISTSEIKISVLIASAYKELAVRSLHTAFGLDVD
jgi:aspartate kinase